MAPRRSFSSPLVGLFAKTALPLVYRHYERKRVVVGNRALFVEQSSPVLTFGMQGICCYLDNDCGCEVRFISLGESRTSLKRQIANQLHLAKQAATSSYIFYDGEVPALSSLPLRLETKLVNLKNYAGCSVEDICIDVMSSHHGIAFNTQSQQSETVSNTLELSVIVPAHNSELFLARAVDSVLAQTYPRERMELILVDDGSTDATHGIIQAYAAEHPNLVRSITLPEASGSPAAPRNRGLDVAQGEYVFFLDSDDWLAPKTVELMMRHAREWASDVLLVRMASEDGRGVPRAAFKGNVPRADTATSGVLSAWGPLKLFRRDVLEHGALGRIRFSESFMPEDAGFVLRAYFAADTISVASDYAYYHVSMHEEGEHAVSSVWSNIDSNLRSYSDLLAVADVLAEKADIKPQFLPRLFKRDVHRMLISLGGYPEEEQLELLCRMRVLFGPRYIDDIRKTLPAEARISCDAAFLGSKALALDALLKVSSQHLSEACEWRAEGGRLVFRYEHAGESIEGDVTDAATASFELMEVSSNSEGMVFSGRLSAWTGFSALGKSINLTLVAMNSDNNEMSWPAMIEWIDAPNVEGTRELAGSWSARLDYDDLTQFDLDGASPLRIRLFVRLSWQGWSVERRLAQKATLRARRAYEVSEGALTLSNGRTLPVTPVTSSYCKFDLEVGSRS